MLHVHVLIPWQAITVLNHAGVCVSYTAAWKYLLKLTTDAMYHTALSTGKWFFVYDNVNVHQRVSHEREGIANCYHKTYHFM